MTTLVTPLTRHHGNPAVSKISFKLKIVSNKLLTWANYYLRLICLTFKPIICTLAWAMCLCPCSHAHNRFIKVKYDMSRPQMFFAKPLREHWLKKHVSETGCRTVKKRSSTDTKEETEAVVSSLAVHYADANIRVRAVERKTLYNFGKALWELFVKAGPSTPFAQLFPNEKICGRKKLTNRLNVISSNLKALLW